jgi:hypothetical protein
MLLSLCYTFKGVFFVTLNPVFLPIIACVLSFTDILFHTVKHVLVTTSIMQLMFNLNVDFPSQCISY